MDNQNLPAKLQIKITFPDELRKQEIRKMVVVGIFGLAKIIKHFYPTRL